MAEQTPQPQHLDRLRQVLQTGDFVIYAKGDSRDLLLGRIVRFDSLGCVISYGHEYPLFNPYGQTCRKPEEVLKVETPAWLNA